MLLGTPSGPADALYEAERRFWETATAAAEALGAAPCGEAAPPAPGGHVRRPRANALRNRAALLEAARAVFRERGLEAPPPVGARRVVHLGDEAGHAGVCPVPRQLEERVEAGGQRIQAFHRGPSVRAPGTAASRTKDFPLVQGIILFSASVYVVTNLVVDLTCGALDPRIRAGMGSAGA
jgi:hypothetical protein